jgi:hypothetical protein
MDVLQYNGEVPPTSVIPDHCLPEKRLCKLEVLRNAIVVALSIATKTVPCKLMSVMACQSLKQRQAYNVIHSS